VLGRQNDKKVNAVFYIRQGEFDPSIHHGKKRAWTSREEKNKEEEEEKEAVTVVKIATASCQEQVVKRVRNEDNNEVIMTVPKVEVSNAKGANNNASKPKRATKNVYCSAI